MKVAKFATLVALIYSSITLLYTANADDSPPPNIVTTIDTRQTCPSGTIPVIQKSNLVCIYIIDLFDFGSGGFAGGGSGSGGAGAQQGAEGNDQDSDTDQECSGNPILIGTGNKVEYENDYVGRGEFPLTVSRTYNNFSDTNGIFGAKWQSNLSYKMTTVGSFGPAMKIIAHRPDGSELEFHYFDPSYFSAEGLWVDRRNNVSNGFSRNSDGTWTYNTEFGYIEKYSSDGRILKITNPDGISHSYTYSGTTLTKITHSSGRYLTLTWSGGKLRKITDPAGNQYLYNYSGAYLSSVTKPGSPALTKTYIYGDSRFPGALTQININGTKYATFSYHSNGKGASTAHWASNSVQVEKHSFSYGSTNTTTTNPLGHKQTYRYDVINGVKKLKRVDRIAATDCPAANRQVTYDNNGIVKSTFDWKGVETLSNYDSNGLLQSQTYAKGTAEERTTTYTWIANENRISSIQTADSKLENTYHASGRLASAKTTNLASYGTAGETRTITYTYTNYSNGIMSKMVIDGPRTDVTDKLTYNYDSKGNLTTIVNALGHTTTYSNYDVLGNPRRMTTPNGLIVDYTYDARGKVLTQKVHHPAGVQTTSYQYNAMGQVLRVNLPDGNYLRNQYDQAYRLIKTLDRNNAYIYYARNANSDVVSRRIIKETTRWTLPPGCWGGGGPIAKAIAQSSHMQAFYYCEPVQETVYENQKVDYYNYDVMGRLQKAIGNNGQSTDYDYDNNSNIKSVKDSYGRATTYTHDGLNRVKTVKDPNNKITRYSYDAGGRVKTVTDARGLTTTYNYSGFGELEQLSSPDTGVTNYDYNKSGQVTRMTRNDGVVSSFSYDALGRITSENHGGMTKTYVYDSGSYRKGRLYYVNDPSGQTVYSYDKVGNIIQKRSKVNGTYYYTKYSYDGMNRVTSVTYPSGKKVLYSYDNMGRVSQVRYQNGSTTSNVATNLKYRPFGPLSEMTHGNGAIRQISHDLDYRPMRITTNGIQNLIFQFDKNDNITKITNGYVSANTQTYGYDTVNRLTSSNSTNAGHQTYNYDAVGNRTKRYKNGALQETNTYAPTSNKLTKINSSSITYNSNGQTRTKAGATFNYNAENRLSSHLKSGVTTSFKHNALGQRVYKRKGNDINYYFYDEAGQLIAEYAITGKIWKEYIYLHGQVIGFTRNGTLYHVHNDHLGRAERITNSSKTTVWRANNNDFDRVVTTNSIGGYNLGFPGQYYDQETGLYYNYFRDYDPSTGRYIQSDPIGLAAGVNTYAYVGANPVNWFDPFGLSACSCSEQTNSNSPDGSKWEQRRTGPNGQDQIYRFGRWNDTWVGARDHGQFFQDYATNYGLSLAASAGGSAIYGNASSGNGSVRGSARAGIAGAVAGFTVGYGHAVIMDNAQFMSQRYTPNELKIIDQLNSQFVNCVRRAVGASE
ncbi:RHS repeat-associated core domain-containing protein [Kangiella sp. TOML190]|uniref:RHS repeat-associated core domain-containing protein n=1 Tax=Kangiella sp. TOML190 TaxID=2931351 RepID=UPI00203B2C88|nr:RHS repeat-associated core domain-containing protein [Kangiella sp. TOML190]